MASVLSSMSNQVFSLEPAKPRPSRLSSDIALCYCISYSTVLLVNDSIVSYLVDSVTI